MRALAIVVVIGFGAAPIAAEPAPRIGFVNASVDTDAGRAAIDALRAEAARTHADLTGAAKLRDWLEGPLPDPTNALVGPRARLDAARDASTRFAYADALAQLTLAETALARLEPTREVLDMLADLNLLAGLVHLGEKRTALAQEAFRLVHRIAPDRTALDPATYRPEAVKLYARAIAARPKPRTITIVTDPPDARVVVDGDPIERAGDDITVAAGDHYVVAISGDHRVEGMRVTVAPGSAPIAIAMPRVTPEQTALGIRGWLVAHPAADWLPEVAALARLAEVDVLVVVRDRGDGVLEGAAYDVRQVALSAWHPVAAATAFVTALIGAPRPVEPRLLPAPVPVAAALPTEVPPAKPSTPWYRTWWGPTLIGGVAAVVILSIVLTSSSSGPDGPD